MHDFFIRNGRDTKVWIEAYIGNERYAYRYGLGLGMAMDMNVGLHMDKGTGTNAIMRISLGMDKVLGRFMSA